MPVTLIQNNDHFGSTDLLSRSYQDDVVDGVYKIHIDRPVNELNNQFCRYYFVTNLETEQEYFGIVFERNFNVSIEKLAMLKKAHLSYLNQIITYSLVRLSSSRKYQIVAICAAYNPEHTLQKHIENHGIMSNIDVEMKLVPALIKIMEFCDVHKINCGNINPQNILVMHDGHIMLREFINVPPNFYQPIAYLAPELGDTMPNAREVHGHLVDIYAVGMTICYALIGLTPSFSTHDNRFINAVRIEEGTYNVIVRSSKIPVQFRPLLAWTLQDNKMFRWNVQKLSEWLSSKNTKNQHKMPVGSNLSGHTTLFEGHNYSNPGAIASAMYIFYERGIRLCYDDNFIKWAQKVRGKVDHIEDFFKTRSSISVFSNIIDAEKEEMFMKVLSMLDGCTNIRLRNFCITIESIPSLIFSAIYNEQKVLFDSIVQILRRNYWRVILSPETASEVSQEYIDKLTALGASFSSNDSEYSGKQAMYALDPYVPCLSSSIINDYVLSVSDLLIALDKVAAHTPNKLNIDDHIVSFIASRLDKAVVEDNKIKVDAAQFADSVAVKGISLLAIAQESTHDIRIPHLCSILAQKLIEWANDNLHSTKLRKVITSEIAELAGNGNLASMLYVISNPKLFQNDYRGYKVACHQAMEMTNTMRDLSDSRKMRAIGISLGQRLTVLFSYLLCMIVTLILVV
jgi:hypothetical protein